MLNFIENRRRYQDPNKWWKMVIWYGFQIAMIVLVVINICFLFKNWGQLELSCDNDNVFLTFIGFLFAFAGINIYSIFNTNIEEEKERLNELRDKYERQLSSEVKKIWYYQRNILNLFDIYQLGQLVVNTERFNYQVYEWVNQILTIIQDFKKFIDELKEIDSQLSDEIKGSLIDRCRGLKEMVDAYQFKINTKNSTYFMEKEAQSVRPQFIESVNELIKTLQLLENGQFPEEFKCKQKRKSEKTWKEIIHNFLGECRGKLASQKNKK